MPAVRTESTASERAFQRGRFRTWLRRRVRPIFRRAEWWVVGTLVPTLLILGGIGFARYGQAAGEKWTLLDWAYRSLQLLTMESGALEKTELINTELHIARTLLPIVTIYALVRAFLRLCYQGMVHLYIRLFYRRHVIVLGLGGNGFLLATECDRLGQPVVVVEEDAENDRVQHCRGMGITVLVGSVLDPRMLRWAGAARAKYVFAVCGDDGTNCEAFNQIRRIGEARAGKPLTCIVHILDSHLCQLLRLRELESGATGRVRLQFFSVYQSGARAMLREHSPFPAPGSAAPAPHLLVVGLGRLGQSLIVEAAYNWKMRRGKTFADDKLFITVADRDAKRKTGCIKARHPVVDELCEIIPREVEFESEEYENGDFLRASPSGKGRPDVTQVYVCLANDSHSLATALIVRRQLAKHLGPGADRVPIVVRTLYETGVAKLLREEGGDFEMLRPFALFTRVCRPELLLGGVAERIARALHEHYLTHERNKKPREEKPSVKEWEELSEQYREDNRGRAVAILQQIRTIGCDVRTATHTGADEFTLAREDVEDMARMEHDRWRESKKAQKWRYGPVRNDDAKTHPLLIEWKDLPEPDKEGNRQSCREYPEILDIVNLEIHRVSDRSAAESPPPVCTV